MTTTATNPTALADIPEYPMPRAVGCPFDPPPALRALQAQAPITKVRLWDGSTPWLVTRYADQRALLADPRISSDSRLPGFPHPSAGAHARFRDQAPTFLNMDDPEHARLRRMATAPFTIKRVEALRPAIQRIVDDLIDQMLAGPTPVDLVQTFALPVPSLVICHLLGVPYPDHNLFQRTSKLLINWNTPPEVARQAQDTLDDYLDRLITDKLAHPTDDLLSRLAVEQVSTGAADPARAGRDGAPAALRRPRNHREHDRARHPGPAAAPRPARRAARHHRARTDQQHGRGTAALPDHRPHGPAPGRARRHRDRRTRLSTPATASSSPPRPATATSTHSPTPTHWTCIATPAHTSRSGSACTNASASPWPGWNCRSSTAPSTGASPPSAWPPTSLTSGSRMSRASTASTNCPSPGQPTRRKHLEQTGESTENEETS